MKIDQARMERAMDVLAETDDIVAQLKTNVRRAEYILKRKEAHAFLSCEGSVKLRESAAKVESDVVAAYDAHTDAMEQYEIIAAKRETEALVIDVWRSLESSRRQGQ